MKFRQVSILLVVLSLVGCTPSAEPSARDLDDTYRIDLTADTEASIPSPGEAIIVYLIQEGSLVARPRVAPDPLSLPGIVSILASGPTARELDSGLRTAIGETVLALETVSIDSRIITIELSESFGDLPGDEQTLLVGQLVLTLTENFSIDGVVFNLDGEPTPILGPGGEVLERPVTAADYRPSLTLP